MTTLAGTLRTQAQLLTRQQALAAGLSTAQLRAHLTSGRWRRVYPGQHGVYVVRWGDAPLTDLQRIWSAVLAVGGTVAVSHESAIWLARRRGPAPVPVHVAVPDGRSVAAITGVRVHTLPDLGEAVVDARRSPPRVRTAVAAIDAAHLSGDVREALGIVYAAASDRNVTVADLREALGNRKRHRHRAAIEGAITDALDGLMSGLEREYRNVMCRHGLPRGVSQKKVAGPSSARHLDVLVSEGLDSPLVTELDGRLGHELVHEVWRDMDRDNLDEETGRGHLRYGPAQVFGEGCRVAGQVGRSLLRRGWRGTPASCGPTCESQPSRRP